MGLEILPTGLGSEVCQNDPFYTTYEKINSIDSLGITPEDGIFFSKDEFFSTLKGQAIDSEAYENSKKLLILLKMRNLSDLNDLYNVQDVISLLEVIENRFQAIQDRFGYNLRIINSASKLSGCIQKEKSEVILLSLQITSRWRLLRKPLQGGLVVSTLGFR